VAVVAVVAAVVQLLVLMESRKGALLTVASGRGHS